MGKGRISYVQAAILVVILVFTSRIGICDESSGEYHNCLEEVIKKYNLKLPTDCKDVIKTLELERLCGRYLGKEKKHYVILYAYIRITDIINKPNEGFCAIMPIANATYRLYENKESELIDFRYWDEKEGRWYIKEDDAL